MPSKNNIYTVRKVEHEFGLTKVKPKFTKMPELYLELLVNKKKVNPTLAAEKYIHHYDPIVSSEDSINGTFKPIFRVTSQTINDNKPQSPKKGTFNWESSDSMEPSPIIQKKLILLSSFNLAILWF